MTRKQIIRRVCDLHEADEVTATQTIRWGIDGQAWEIDACSGCAAQIRDMLRPLAGHARAAGTSPALLRPPGLVPGRTRNGRLRRDQLDASAVIRAYRDQKLSLAQCASMFGTSRRIIELTLAEHGIVRRPRGRPPRREPAAGSSAGRR
jgi:hypothetical protein